MNVLDAKSLSVNAGVGKKELIIWPNERGQIKLFPDYNFAGFIV